MFRGKFFIIIVCFKGENSAEQKLPVDRLDEYHAMFLQDSDPSSPSTELETQMIILSLLWCMCRDDVYKKKWVDVLYWVETVPTKAFGAKATKAGSHMLISGLPM